MSLPSAQSSRAKYEYAALLAALFAYLFFARTREATDSFLLLRDQIRDWRVALGSFTSLPLTGPQSTAGGASFGPIYYWVLWLSRCLIGPLVQNLPHAGAYGISTLQTAMDLLLLDTLRRRLGSISVALAIVLFAATASHDLAVSATIWNPAVSVAFVKLAIALRLRRGNDASLWWTAGTTASAWLAVQAHSAAFFVAGPLAASYAVDDLLNRRPVRALQQIRAIVEVVVLLQVPFFVYVLTGSAEALPTRALAGASQAVATGDLRWSASLEALLNFVTSILSAPWRSTVWPPVIALLIVAALMRARRDVPMLAATVAPLAAAGCGLALWQGNYDEYWYLPFVPCAALAAGVAVTWWRPQVSAVVLMLIVIGMQPGRLTHSLQWYRMPQYGPIVTGTKRITHQTMTLRRLSTTFAMPPLADAAFPFEAMGGRFSAEAPFDAVIDERGDVAFVPVTH